MRRMVAGLFLSVDGVMEAPETWTGPYMDDDMGQAIGAEFAGSDAMVLGRRTYETFAAAFAGRSDPMAQIARSRFRMRGSELIIQSVTAAEMLGAKEPAHRG